MKKSILVLALALFIFAGCSKANENESIKTAGSADADTTNTTATSEADTTTKDETNDEPQDELLLTLEELAQYDGQDDNPAYVAVNGTIYDMTDSRMWKNGTHNGFQAGQDLTEALLNQSPHGESALENVPIVGKIVEASTDGDTTEADTEATTQDAEPAMQDTEATTQDTESSMQDTEPETQDTQGSAEDGTLKLTLDELAQYDGQNDNPAYIAYKSSIYDVTGVSAWRGGTHHGNLAGTDVTDALKNAPHGEENLDGIAIVGELVE